MATDSRKVMVGSLLLLVSTALIMGTVQLGDALPALAASLATLGLAAGALLVGTSEDARPV
ncbi:hypothetical protein [Halomicrobium salinisoli]|uniref:hypothetical protein n=1 Tax=Halomicrobium salinisoli TaxID=2878391 RepID=UPI001CF0BFA2|nr:hypothetical protein [Halomicrobium salinisoli]